MKARYFVIGGAILYLLLLCARLYTLHRIHFLRDSLDRLKIKEKVYITNYVNPESIILPPTYHTSVWGLNSTGYTRWIFIVTNLTDDVQLIRQSP